MLLQTAPRLSSHGPHPAAHSSGGTRQSIVCHGRYVQSQSPDTACPAAELRKRYSTNHWITASFAKGTRLIKHDHAHDEANRMHKGIQAEVTAIMLGALLFASQPAHSQDPGQMPEQGQTAEGRNRGGIPGGQMVRGVVAEVTPDHLRLKQEDGQIVQVIVTANTRILKQRQPVKLTDIRAGDGMGAAGIFDAANKTMHAAMIFVVDAGELRKAQENLGKTYITGKITAIDDLKLTVSRPDGVAQTMEVDEDTSFRRGGRGGNMGMLMGGPGGTADPSGTPPAGAAGATRPDGGESITLADVKIGDTIFATGALKGGLFHPTELRVAPPRRHRDATAPTAAPQ